MQITPLVKAIQSQFRKLLSPTKIVSGMLSESVLGCKSCFATFDNLITNCLTKNAVQLQPILKLPNHSLTPFKT